MSKYHDDNTVASDPGGVSLSQSKLSEFRNELPLFKKMFSNLRYPFEMLDEHLNLGDSRAAMVLEIQNRLIVAAYTDELDCVVLLEFPIRLVNERNLRVGDRLLTVNTYSKGLAIVPDLEKGPGTYNRYINFYPLIADFLSCDINAIESRKLGIEEEEWNKTKELGQQKLSSSDVTPRNGSPYTSIHAGR